MKSTAIFIDCHCQVRYPRAGKPLKDNVLHAHPGSLFGIPFPGNRSPSEGDAGKNAEVIGGLHSVFFGIETEPASQDA